MTVGCRGLGKGMAGIKSHSHEVSLAYFKMMGLCHKVGWRVSYVDELLRRDAVLLQQHATQALLPARHTQTWSNI